MTRAVRFTLTAGAVALVCACRSDSLNPPIGRPQASFADGAHSGNRDFFFLPPIFKNPSSDRNFTAGAFNASVRPTVEICQLIGDACGATIKSFGAADIQLDATNEQYVVNWDTKASGLVLTEFYRIRVFLGPNTELGHVDIDPVASGAGLKRVDTDEFIGLVDGRTLPISFRIENGAACQGGACDSKTIDLVQGGFVVLTTTGDRVDIPAQSSGVPVTVTVQQCAGLDVDIPVFGNCLRITADPPLGETPLSPPATVSICSLDELTLPLTHAQSELVTLHRQDAGVEGNVVVALPHSTDFCQGTIGRSAHTGPQTLAGRTWRAIRDAARWVFHPATLHARTMVLDVGAGGQTDGFSDFQLALPGKMVISSLADQTSTPNTAVPSAPSVLVTDAEGNPVANARVHFQITTGGGSFLPPSPITTDETGHATLTQWVLGAAGPQSLQASGRGIADPEHNGPGEGFDPFAPAVLHNPGDDEAQPPVTLGTGHLTFTATAGLADLIIESLTQLPTNPADLDLIEYTAVVKNIGSAPAGHFMVLINVDEVVSGEPVRGIEATSLSSGPPGTVLNPGATVALRRQRTLELNAGNYQLTGTADANTEVPESDESNNTAVTRFSVSATGQLIARPVTTLFQSASGLALPLTEHNGLSMQRGTGIQLEVRPSEPVTWSSDDPLGAIGSVNTTGLVAVVQSSEDPAAAKELIVTAAGTTGSDAIKINSYAFDHFPRFTTLVWRPVAGADRYEVELEFGNGCTLGTAVCTTWTQHFGFPVTTSSTGYVLEFVGAQPGRWRVIARNATGGVISTSEDVYFRYLF
ncbi:MAG TPA: CARDB domain-containing protein [Gemmatimonadales bacterium]|nr:CARDB domain-containing protein [Gemmatimonadales bacterium]